jgi:hypothetical protein
MKNFKVIEHAEGGESFSKIQRRYFWFIWLFIIEKQISDLGMLLNDWSGKLPVCFPNHEKATEWLKEKFPNETIRIRPGYKEV